MYNFMKPKSIQVMGQTAYILPVSYKLSRELANQDSIEDRLLIAVKYTLCDEDGKLVFNAATTDEIAQVLPHQAVVGIGLAVMAEFEHGTSDDALLGEHVG